MVFIKPQNVGDANAFQKISKLFIYVINMLYVDYKT